MPLIDLPPNGEVAFFYNRDTEAQVVHTWTACPKKHSDKFIYWVSKNDKIVEKGCWIPGEKIDEFVLIVIEENTNEAAPDIFPIASPPAPIKT